MRFTVPQLAAIFALLPTTLATGAPWTSNLKRHASSLVSRHPIPAALMKRQVDNCEFGYTMCPADFSRCCPDGYGCMVGGLCGDASVTTCYVDEEECGTGTNGGCCIAGSTCNSSGECVAEDSRSSSSGRNGEGNPESGAAGKAATSGGARLALVAVVMAALM